MTVAVNTNIIPKYAKLVIAASLLLVAGCVSNRAIDRMGARHAAQIQEVAK